MIRIVIRSLLFGLLGLVAAPIATFVFALVTGYLFDPRCGTPGDSGGCEMGAATAAIAAAPVGLVIGFVVSLALGLRSRGKAPT